MRFTLSGPIPALSISRSGGPDRGAFATLVLAFAALLSWSGSSGAHPPAEDVPEGPPSLGLSVAVHKP
jgi:hypothetical protein